MRKIPRDLGECFEQLKGVMTPEQVEEFKEGDGSYAHLGVGMSVRNAWGLWSGSPLKDYFRALGLGHADDMSGVILEQFWRHLRELPSTVESQVEGYRRYWDEMTGEQPVVEDTRYVTEW